MIYKTSKIVVDMFQLSGFSNLKDKHITFNLPNNNLIPRKKIFRIPKQNVYSNNQDSVKNKGNPHLCIILNHRASLNL